MNYSIEADNILSFKKNGFLLVRSFFSKSICEELLDEIEKIDLNKVLQEENINSAFIKNKTNTLNYHGLSYLQNANLICPTVNKLMNQSLLTACRQLLDVDDIFFSGNELHIRQPKVSHAIPSHQDNFYFCLENGLALTCYVYLTNQNRASGGLGFFKSSIHKPTLNHEKSSVEGFSSFNKKYESMMDSFTYPETNPGDVIFHYSKTFHRADKNQTENISSSISLRAFSNANLKKDKVLQEKYQKNLEYNQNEQK